MSYALATQAGVRAEQELRGRLARAVDDDERLVALTELARPIVAVDLAHRLVPAAPALADLDVRGHPWAGLLVGIAVCTLDPVHGMAILRGALAELEAAGDDEGVGYACLLIGNEELGAGNIDTAGALWLRARSLLGPDDPAELIAAAHGALALYQAGDLREAIVHAETTLLRARLASNDRAEGIACVYLAFFSWWTGEFTRVEQAAHDAEVALGRIPDASNRYELPLAAAARGAVAGLRGDYDEMECAFAHGLQQALAMHNPWYEAMLLTMRAEFGAPFNPTRSVADALHALRYFETSAETWWSNWARQALAIAQREAGHTRAAAAAVDELLAHQINPLERGRALLLSGDAAATRGDLPAAADAYEKARACLEPQGAHYWTARAETGLAATDSRRAAYWHRAAVLRAGAHVQDPAWQRNLRGPATFRVELLGTARVLVNGVAVRFPTVAALNAVARLAIAHPSAVRAETLAEDLWPGGDPERTTHRLDNLLSQIRTAIRPALRLERTGTLVRLRIDVEECDYLAACRSARDVLRSTDAPDDREIDRLEELLGRLVVGGGYDEWIVEAQAHIDSLRGRISGRWG